MIELKNVTKRYGKQTVVHDVTLSVPKGGAFGFLGQNGAGKTTTMKMLVGLASPDHGEVRIGGRSVSAPEVREGIGFMPEAPYFYDRLTGLEFLEFCSELFTKKRQKGRRAREESLRRVGIYDARNKAIRNYSKGMKQRLAFAQALVNDPEYLFLDEPLDGLDPIGRREVKEIIKGLRAEGKTIFFNSHILYDTEELCDRVGIIHRGKILYAGPIGEFVKGRSLEERFIETVEAADRGNG